MEISILKAHSCHHDCQNDIPDASDAYLLEILLSYRLIFGQDKRSRKLFRDKEISNLSTDRLRDPVLHILCGEKNAYAVTDLIGRFREREVFIPEDDFPQFGERLLKLQEYMVNQRPMGWNAVWNDHRDPQQSFAFWAVVIVGGCSIFLSFAQLVVSVAQLVYAAK
jgi:hypothetical protein